MPSSPSNPTATRVLLIDDGRGLSARLESALHQTPLRIETRSLPGYLMALGELGVTDDAPHAIIGPIDSLNGDLRATALALHELAPRTRLIAVTQSNEQAQPQRAIAAGFDACLTDPASAADLSRALAAPSDEETNEPPQAARAVKTTAGMVSALDTSVLDQMLHPRGDVQAQAIRFIQENSQIEGVSFTPANAMTTAPSSHITVPVEHLSIPFGSLHAPSPATAELLEPWAAWLARWLLLHKQQQDLWFMAMRDELTQAWNRRYFQRFLRMALNRAAEDRSTVTLLLFDVDDFKKYNDRHGHDAGDEILRETVKLMKAVVREQDVVARIGGDEFAVIFWDAEAPRRANSRHPADIAKVVERFRKVLAAHKFPKLTTEALGSLTISGGLASYPWDATTAEDLITKADAMAFQAKKQGKNAITIGPMEGE